MRRATFHQARMEEVLISNSDLRTADLIGANLRSASVFATDLQGSFLAQAQMQGSFLETVRLMLADMSGANLQAYYVISSAFEGTILDNADISGALIVEAHLQGASLKHAKLRAAFFIDSEFRGIDLTKAVIDCARFQTPDPDTIGSLRFVDTSDLVESVRARIPNVELRMKCKCGVLGEAVGGNVWIEGPDTAVGEMLGGATVLRGAILVRIYSRRDVHSS
jgi:hypothetical protein